jgi:hypothetical protein
MRADPEPHEIAVGLDRERAIAQPDPNGPEETSPDFAALKSGLLSVTVA